MVYTLLIDNKSFFFSEHSHSAILAINDDDSFHPQEACEINSAATTIYEI